MKHRITLLGCDDSTRFEMDLTEAEAACVQRMVALAKAASDTCCMPEMEIEVVEQVGKKGSRNHDR